MNVDLIEINNLSKGAMGGSELMLNRLYSTLPRDLLEQFQIIPTRLRDLKEDKFRIYWCHDLPGDPEVEKALANNGWHRFHRIVFCSNWQAQRFIDTYAIPWSKCLVLLNAIDAIEEVEKVEDGTIRLIYHTTPHRGLNILLPVFTKLTERHPNIHLDVYSSFSLYGWKERDQEFKELFDFMEGNEKITNHGAVPNDEVRKALGNAHIFAYPSTWPETSCLCLMEAMSAGLNCVHPNYGALYETSANWTTMYHWHEEAQKHAEMFIMMLDNAIENINNENLKGRLASQRVYANAFYSWGIRAKQWEALLKSIVNQNESKEITAAPQKSDFVYSI
jgi:UDP-glucose:(glucosyl)LPS alpha-1,2-glucosyltransferase